MMLWLRLDGAAPAHPPPARPLRTACRLPDAIPSKGFREHCPCGCTNRGHDRGALRRRGRCAERVPGRAQGSLRRLLVPLLPFECSRVWRAVQDLPRQAGDKRCGGAGGGRPSGGLCDHDIARNAADLGREAAAHPPPGRMLPGHALGGRRCTGPWHRLQAAALVRGNCDCKPRRVPFAGRGGRKPRAALVRAKRVRDDAQNGLLRQRVVVLLPRAAALAMRWVPHGEAAAHCRPLMQSSGSTGRRLLKEMPFRPPTEASGIVCSACTHIERRERAQQTAFEGASRKPANFLSTQRHCSRCPVNSACVAASQTCSEAEVRETKSLDEPCPFAKVAGGMEPEAGGAVPSTPSRALHPAPRSASHWELGGDGLVVGSVACQGPVPRVNVGDTFPRTPSSLAGKLVAVEARRRRHGEKESERGRKAT
mmetsp:Transcript_18713/g.71175  ORF Transcript_18713/g.71175 Transcript_18713/m.71175 type:complete len:424 (+) Transcript_18713:101-1372(+)